MLTKDQIYKYWENRTKQFKEKAVDYKPHEKKKFIFQHLSTTFNTLDYGCGIGIAASNFQSYLGMDIIPDLLKHARRKNPSKDFRLLEDICLPETLDFDIKQFFTATVLQHNPDDVVKEIFQSVANLKPNDIIFCLYENSQTNANHMIARNDKDYVNLLSEYFDIIDYVSYKHSIFKSEHTLTIVKV